MPVITDISLQQNRAKRYNIYIDSAYHFSLSETQVGDLGIRIGDELSEARLHELEEASVAGKAFDQALNYLSYRPRSRMEMLRYLRRKHKDEHLAMTVVEELEQRNLVDDVKFATDWVEMRQALSPRSRMQLRAELREKGISANTIDAVLQGINAAAEVQVVIEVIQKKRLLQRYTDRQKLIRYLAGKGFQFDIIAAALEQLETNS